MVSGGRRVDLLSGERNRKANAGRDGPPVLFVGVDEIEPSKKFEGSCVEFHLSLRLIRHTVHVALIYGQPSREKERIIREVVKAGFSPPWSYILPAPVSFDPCRRESNPVRRLMNADFSLFFFF